MKPHILKFGFHNFLNAQPVLVPLLRKAPQTGFEMVLDSPARLAEQLQAGRLDLAMIPSVEYLKEAASYRLVPDLAIASRGPVSTVLLASNKPLEEVRTLGLDNRSRTSVSLMNIVFGAVLPADCVFSPVEPDPVTQLKTHDAVLVIGDQALGLAESVPGVTVYDLSERWFGMTGLPFVHAVAAVRPEVELSGAQARAILDAKAEGRASLASIVRSQAEQSGREEAVLEDYLSHRIHYDLGDEELEGLGRFQDLCVERKLLPRKHPFAFVQTP